MFPILPACGIVSHFRVAAEQKSCRLLNCPLHIWLALLARYASQRKQRLDRAPRAGQLAVCRAAESRPARARPVIAVKSLKALSRNRARLPLYGPLHPFVPQPPEADQ